MRKAVFIFSVLLFCSFAGMANEEIMQQFQKANEAYSKSKYKEALALYTAIQQKGFESPELYFNMGNAAFKTDSLPLAILYYEKAKKLAPLDEDIQVNLKIANLKTIDKTEVPEELFMVSWARQFMFTKGSRGWAWQAVISLFVAFSLLCFYILGSTPARKKLFFFSALVFFFISLVSFLLAHSSHYFQSRSDQAVLFAESAQVRSAPDEVSTSLFLVHSGIKFTVLEQNGDYSRIRLSNGNEGWVKTLSFRNI